MKQGEYLILESRTLNDNYEQKAYRLRDANDEARKLAERSGKIMVIVKIVEVIVPSPKRPT